MALFLALCPIWGALFPILSGGSVSPAPEDHETHEDHKDSGDPRAGAFVGEGMIHWAVPPPTICRVSVLPSIPPLGGGDGLIHLRGSLPHLREVSDPLGHGVHLGWGGSA